MTTLHEQAVNVRKAVAKLKLAVGAAIRGEFYTWTWELHNCLVVGIAERDVIGFHWTLTVYGWAGRRIVISQGRSFTMVEAQSALCSHMMARRWMLERCVHAPAGVRSEFNLRRWICDFFKVP